MDTYEYTYTYIILYIYISHLLYYLFIHCFHIFLSTVSNDNEHRGADTPSKP